MRIHNNGWFENIRGWSRICVCMVAAWSLDKVVVDFDLEVNGRPDLSPPDGPVKGGD